MVRILYWKQIDAWNIKPIYLISQYGDIKNKNTGKLRKSHVDKDGYLNVVLYTNDNKKSNFKVHRLVAFTFKLSILVGPMQVNHIDGNKLNNHISNLEWVTNRQNINHAKHNGLRNKTIAFDIETIHTICKFIEDGYSTREILDYFNIGKSKKSENYQRYNSLIHGIRTKIRWTDVSENYNF